MMPTRGDTNDTGVTRVGSRSSSSRSDEPVCVITAEYGSEASPQDPGRAACILRDEQGKGGLMAKKDRQHEIQDEPIPRHVFDDPRVQRDIEEALERARRGDGKPGMTAPELRALADEERRRLES